MKRCPKCQRTYEATEVECTDCRVALEESNPELNEPTEASMTGRWQLLRTAANDIEANIIRGILETAGIPSRLEAETATRLYGITSGALGGIRIYVPADAWKSAQDILDADIVPEDPPE